MIERESDQQRGDKPSEPETPRTDEWEANGEPYADLINLARCLERELEALKAAKGYMQGIEVTGPGGTPVAAPCALDGCALMQGGYTRSAGGEFAALRELVELKRIKDALDDHAAGVKLLGEEWFDMTQTYRQRKPLAWKRAKEVVAGCAQSASGEWVAIKERLPKAGGTYLVGGWRKDLSGCFDFGIGHCFRLEDGPVWGIDREKSTPHFDIEYWAELPNRPKAKATKRPADRNTLNNTDKL